MLAKNEILQGRYRIICQLGHGGMGTVYEAIDERFGTPVALKEILIESANEKQKSLIINAFEREAKSLAKAGHEAIPYVRDYFSELDRQFLVMELVKGEDLAEMLVKRGKPFSVQEILNWADQLLDALDYLHNLTPSIIHRDIKPHNLKLSFRRKIKLLDFGIAKSGDRSSTVTNNTFVGATLEYSPIEQLLRVIDPTFREFIILKHKEQAEKVLNQNTDVRCDIYALGATFYHLLTNHLPEAATKRILAIWENKADPLPNPSELNPEIPPSISACLLRAMAIERENRYSSAIEMQEALQTAVDEEKLRKSEEKYRQTIEQIKPQDEKIEENQEQLLTQAVTEKIIPEIVPKDNITEVNLSAPASPTEPLHILPLDTQISSDFHTVQKLDTQQSGNISAPKLTENLYTKDILPEETKITSEPVFLVEKETEQASDNQKKVFWLLPITAIGILTVSGIGGIMWLSSSSPTDSTNKQAANTVVSTPTVVPIIKPTVEPKIEPSVSPNIKATPDPKPSNPVINKEKPIPTVAPKQLPVVIPTTRPTPKAKKTPNLSDDCIYNGKCD